MKSFLLILFVSTAIVCSGQSAKVYRQSYDRFIELDSSSIILIPIEWDNNAKIGEIKIQGNNRTKNLIFYNPISDSVKFLFSDSLQIITSFDGPLLSKRDSKDTTKRPRNKDQLYYSVINEDYNEDKKLDGDDPIYLYGSKYDGTSLTLLTIQHSSLKYYRYINDLNIILATLTIDENKDKKFDSRDSEILYKIDLNDLKKSKVITKMALKGDSK